MATATKLKTVHLKLPASTEELAKLEIGTVVYLTGRVYTAREGVYKKAVEEGSRPAGDAGRAGLRQLPLLAGRQRQRRRQPHGGRGDGHRLVPLRQVAGRLVQAVPLQHHHRQGRHDRRDLQGTFVPHKAIYLTTVGYGTGALLGRGIRRVVATHWVEELGLAQAIWVMDVENFGPFLVDGDLAGNSLFERENAKIAPGIDKLYAGTKPATLRRYGETDDKTDEVI